MVIKGFFFRAGLGFGAASIGDSIRVGLSSAAAGLKGGCIRPFCGREAESFWGGSNVMMLRRFSAFVASNPMVNLRLEETGDKDAKDLSTEEMEFACLPEEKEAEKELVGDEKGLR
jgi:hypothetical protein